MTLYVNLAELLGSRIENGFYRPGDRLPSVRALSVEHGVSLSTVQQAYRVLEDNGLASPKPKSGYFVPAGRTAPALPAVGRPAQRPVEISQWDQVLELIRVVPNKDVIQLGRGMPDITSPTLKPLLRSLATISRRQDMASLYYDTIYGTQSLREQVARLMLDSGCQLTTNELVITTGCSEALSTSLRAICQTGDIVAVDSPSFHGVMQMLKGFGLKALEIPTDPITGISLEALELALEQWPIKAIQLTPNCNNPLGYIMPEANKKALLTLAQRYDVAIIEDDVYGDLAYTYPRPRTIKSFDEDGRVLLCSSFSKTLAPGVRIGWVAPGRYLEQVLHMKYISTGCTATQPQLAIAEFLKDGHYEPHLRRMRGQYQRGRDQMTDWVMRYFPQGTRVSRPQGGFMLWVELPEDFDTLRLNRALLGQGVQVAGGSIFSAAGKYRNCLRMNYASKPTAEIEAAVRTVGAAITHLLSETA
ncbi:MULTISPECIES: PLP-dependent aminotransferase family protein [unclassified Pseudomonas]|uniref:aminotransferase-like domain-containing protein n=1 Tax=unclassified Pseudomonas TaxID=196821 RepID=UPI002AC8E031|nr:MULTISPECIES: PLP-dependent aminotransferase family protein [unclassified Pseudomonas]MEB0041612.1 PLP-dependent aminotransferase family protein [Pseudomonas sp. MH10]MEB0077847.1 PLP-dependent aminotransferase family protein [Pseudomonas sp. MH10out]MEB0092356.1 PLP-dependent aminotransferase family protein [Pseudomonas sp. CCI4.2]MEB0102942.1 PLP-dependent aminotransferase family protein [Pseudomonas sp. CCI3.2]MEB0123244.1 PLP-dependent aminotransferase family protein [Pseudomonas sp. CC